MSSSEPSKRTMDIVDTELPADSVEFCPRDGSRNILVCGTYNLVKNDQGDADSPGSKQPQTRDGRCLVYEVGETSQTLKEVHRIETAAILDLKWSYDNISSNPILAVAESVGSIRIYEWHQQEKKLSASQVIQVGDPHTLCLSIDWNNRVSYQGGHRLIVSKSDGGLSVLKPSESRMEVELVWHAHDFEPWIAAWNYWTPQVAYSGELSAALAALIKPFSGGDDCKLKGWDTRTSCDSPIFVNRRYVNIVASCGYLRRILVASRRGSLVFKHTLTWSM
ncbi:hypothetical protein FRC08_013392 [Ceratobasidium sp. 394]|nr:hypothetical protein FRC08_013392 [Ceratobasidium sp. 394]